MDGDGKTDENPPPFSGLWTGSIHSSIHPFIHKTYIAPLLLRGVPSPVTTNEEKRYTPHTMLNS